MSDQTNASSSLPVLETLLLRLESGVLHLTLNRPQARNALTLAMVADLQTAFAWVVANERQVRAVVMRGAGGHFCAGGDLKDMMSSGMRPAAAGEPDPIAVLSRRFGHMLRAAEALPAVLITVCEGSVMAGGFGLVCVSDIALAQAGAMFGMPETARGLPPAQIAPFLVERVGLTATRRICLTGARFDAQRARTLGVVHEVYEDEATGQALLDEVLSQVLGCAPLANRVTKSILLQVGHTDRERILDDAADQFAAAVRGSEAPEGIAAFLQKRQPKWAIRGQS